MTLFYFSIALTISASVLYHVSQKAIPAPVNPIVSVTVSYILSLALCGLLLIFMPPSGGFVAALRQLNWATYILPFSLLGLELGYLLVYRAGWNIGLTAVLVNVTASLMLIPIALFVFRDKLNWVNIAGIMICLVGLAMLNWNR
jgi:drug/metabolite transporter (DMT)-like permease